MKKYSNIPFFISFIVIHQFMMSQESAALMAGNSSPYYLLRLDNVPTSMSLHQLLYKIYPSCRYIIGIYRTADYVNEQLGHTVFFMCNSANDASFLSSIYIRFVEGRDAQQLVIVDSITAIAKLPQIDIASKYECKAVAIHLTKLWRHKYREPTTDYLASIATYFEARGTMTSFRLNYDVFNECTRSDGFCSYLKQRDGFEVAGEITAKIHAFNNHRIEAVLSHNLPMIVRLQDAHILTKGVAVWNEDLDQYNQTMFRRRREHANRSQNNSNVLEVQVMREPQEVLPVDVVDEKSGKQFVSKIPIAISRDSSNKDTFSLKRAATISTDSHDVVKRKSFEFPSGSRQVTIATGSSELKVASVVVKPPKRIVSLQEQSTSQYNYSSSSAKRHDYFKPTSTMEGVNRHLSSSNANVCRICAKSLKSANGHEACHKQTQTYWSAAVSNDFNDLDDISVKAVRNRKNSTTGQYPMQFGVDEAQYMVATPTFKVQIPVPSSKYARRNAEMSHSDWESDDDRLIIDNDEELND